MALSPRLITDNTPVAAVVLLAILAATGWAIVEFAPQRDALEVAERPAFDQQPYEARAAHHALDVVFHPEERPTDPALCDWTAEQVFHHFRPLVNGERVSFHTRGISGLVGAYIDLGCPAAIHEGDWEKTAQILGVGMVYETLKPQAQVYAPGVQWDERADGLVPTATRTYEVLSPHKTCSLALHQDELDPHRAADEFTPLMRSCLRAFRH